MNKLIMIMGLQRSGTNALLYSLAGDERIRAYNESEDNEVFKDCFLRPESDIRAVLQRSGQKAALIKAISETRIRGVNEVFDEYKDYELWIACIYRDPVNTFYSTVKKWPQWPEHVPFAAQWNIRYQRLLSVSPEHASRFAIVRYEDIIKDPKVFFDLCAFLGLKGRYLFRADRAGGRKNLSEDISKEIEARTKATLQKLDENRRFVAREKIGLTWFLRKIIWLLRQVFYWGRWRK